MLVVDPHVCGKKVVGFHLFVGLWFKSMVKIALCVIQFSTVPECVFVKNPLAHCFRAVWVYRLKVYIYI